MPLRALGIIQRGGTLKPGLCQNMVRGLTMYIEAPRAAALRRLRGLRAYLPVPHRTRRHSLGFGILLASRCNPVPTQPGPGYAPSISAGDHGCNGGSSSQGSGARGRGQ
jgi:hypothetical protein